MYIDHVGINTNDMEATLQFYCGILGMRLVRTTRTPDGRRHYNVEHLSSSKRVVKAAATADDRA